MAMGLPINQAIDRIFASARELNAAAERTSEGQSFGQRLAQAVRRKQSPCVFAATRKNDDDNDGNDENGDKDKDADDDSFGKRIKKAIERKSRASKTQQQHKKIAERKRRRYQQPATTQAH